VLTSSAILVLLLIVWLVVINDRLLDVPNAVLFLLLFFDALVESGFWMRDLLNLEVVDGLDQVLALLLHEVLVLV
jgi:hypothetical protein